MKTGMQRTIARAAEAALVRSGYMGTVITEVHAIQVKGPNDIELLCTMHEEDDGYFPDTTPVTGKVWLTKEQRPNRDLPPEAFIEPKWYGEW